METLHNGFTLEYSKNAFPFSTDSMVLADFVKLPKNAKVLDLGSGCGTLGVLLCAKDSGCAVTGIELDPCAHEMALHNASANKIESRLTSICGDLNNISSLVAMSSVSVCISNPPYFSSGFKSQTMAAARHEDNCSMDALFKAANWALKFGGDFFVVHKPERLAELFTCAIHHSLQPKTLCLVRHRADGPVSLVLVQCRKGGKPGLIWQEQALHDAQGNPTEFYRGLYHIQEV